MFCKVKNIYKLYFTCSTCCISICISGSVTDFQINFLIEIIALKKIQEDFPMFGIEYNWSTKNDKSILLMHFSNLVELIKFVITLTKER